MKIDQAEAIAFGKGVDALREHLESNFRRLGITEVLCFQVADVIRDFPRPALPPKG